MPINTGFGVMNTGKDVKTDIVQANGSILSLNITTSFDKKPLTKELNSPGLDGIHRFGVIPGGWELDWEIDRADRTTDDWWAAYEEAYYAGRVNQNLSVTETILEGDGSVSIWRYEGLAMHYTDAGRAKADDFIKQKIRAKCSKRIRVQ